MSCVPCMVVLLRQLCDAKQSILCCPKSRPRFPLSGSIAKKAIRCEQDARIGLLGCCCQNPSNEAAAQHRHGVQHRLRRRLGRDPPPRAAPTGSSDPKHASNRLRRGVDGMDVGHHRTDQLSTAKAANARGREEAPDRVDRGDLARPHQHHPPARRRQATAEKRAGHLRHPRRAAGSGLQGEACCAVFGPAESSEFA